MNLFQTNVGTKPDIITLYPRIHLITVINWMWQINQLEVSKQHSLIDISSQRVISILFWTLTGLYQLNNGT